MVRIRPRRRPRSCMANSLRIVGWIFLILGAIWTLLQIFVRHPPHKQSAEKSRITTPMESAAVNKDETFSSGGKISSNVPTSPGDRTCEYQTLDDLTAAEAHPQEATKHIVTPPSDEGSTVSLVCCQSTAGPLTIAVHPNWAPRGAERFLFLVGKDYFESRVPLFRCIQGWICQFGLPGSPHNLFNSLVPDPNDRELKDDVQWLLEGPKHRMHGTTKRFAQGYLAYAGGGPNTRDNQFILALEADGHLGGGSPWEVPWGEVIGPDSYVTLSRIYTGYGEDGPSQESLFEHGVTPDMEKEFPKLDYITSCNVIDSHML